MPIDTSAIGRTLAPVSLDIERGRLGAFARATGQTDPLFTDLDTARAAGHPDLPVPPTFLFAIELEQQDPFGWLTDLGVDLRFVLHGSQQFDYHRTAHAGEHLTATPRITDIYSKRGGVLEFIVKVSSVADDAGRPVADLTTVIVVRNSEVAG